METFLKAFMDMKDFYESIFYIFSSASLIAAGCWTYKIFIRKRERFPSANLRHSITALPINEEKLLLVIEVEIENRGPTILQIEKGFTRLLQVAPLDSTALEQISNGALEREATQSRFEWPMLEKVSYYPSPSQELEPGESDSIYFEFLVERKLQTLIAWTTIENLTKSKRNFSWGKMTHFVIYHDKHSFKSNPARIVEHHT